jgi:iron-sulfur cluster assembly protein
MVHISEHAEKVLQEYFKDKEISPIRILVQSGGWRGPSLAMVLDEPKETDEVFKVNGYTMLLDRDLNEQIKDVSVDYVHYGVGSGFKLTSEIPIGGGGASCSSSCSC